MVSIRTTECPDCGAAVIVNGIYLCCLDCSWEEEIDDVWLEERTGDEVI